MKQHNQKLGEPMMLTTYLRGLMGKCPHCGRGQMMYGLAGVHERCTHCGLIFETDPGDFTGAVVLGYGVSSIPVLLGAMVVVLVADVPIGWVLLVGSLLIALIGTLTYRPLKGLWIAFLVDTHALTPPREGR